MAIVLEYRHYNILTVMVITTTLCSGQRTPMYTDVGENITLPCFSDDYNKSSWEGPCLATTECVFNKIIYFHGLIKNRFLSNSIFLRHDTKNMNGIYSLSISTVSLANEGVYTCVGLQNGVISDKKFTVWLKEQTSSIVIRNMTASGTIQGTEAEPLRLACEVNSEMANINIALYKGFTKLVAGESKTVEYSFIPTPMDDGQLISCVVQRLSINVSLNKRAVLDIKYKPSVHFTKENQLIIEGNEFFIHCLTEGNPPVNSTFINKDSHTLKTCDKSSCRLNLRGSRNESGEYNCTAVNEIGINNSSTTVTILYPPYVTVSLSAYELHCDAAGVPNNATIVSWKHYTHGGTFLRMFEGSEFYSLSSSYPRYMIDGLYICEATNGIPHTNGKTIATGNYSIKIPGKPEILARTKRIQFGRHNDLSTIQIFVHSFPQLVDTKIVKNETLVGKKRPIIQTFHYINEHIFGKEVWIEGYTISLQIPSTREEDFGNYTFVLRNSKGTTYFTTRLTMNSDSNGSSSKDNGKILRYEYVIGISVGSSLISAVLTGICMFFFCMKRKRKSSEIQRNETDVNEPQYEEIIEMNEGDGERQMSHNVEEISGNDSMIVIEQSNQSMYLEPVHSEILEIPETDKHVDTAPMTIDPENENSLSSSVIENEERLVQQQILTTRAKMVRTSIANL